ncbi:hypothetical protein KFK09_006597 [Dendrobium nobile]|uniref:Uncharacterized protein n=1 Tax=Dendrobium nobile TaxID=94219 RepID=A0A8T3BSU8_DENNO|nr:hypothetical protein KFK09_006597 [Dendrobium nobile]
MVLLVETVKTVALHIWESEIQISFPALSFSLPSLSLLSQEAQEEKLFPLIQDSTGLKYLQVSST